MGQLCTWNSRLQWDQNGAYDCSAAREAPRGAPFGSYSHEEVHSVRPSASRTFHCPAKLRVIQAQCRMRQLRGRRSQSAT
jgi:hypothetical protein